MQNDGESRIQDEKRFHSYELLGLGKVEKELVLVLKGTQHS